MLRLKSSCAGFGSLIFGSGTKLTVLDPQIPVTKPNVTVLPPSPKEICGKVTLVCVATDFYPDHVAVSWKINNETVTSGVGTENSAHSLNKMYSISSRLQVKKSVWQNTANTFTCSVQFFDGEDNVTVTDIIHGQSGSGLTVETVRRAMLTARFAYLLFLGKSILYALVVGGLVWKIRGSKQSTGE
ncbi:T cell receptor beta chain MC.7.G5-like [Clupea harengus]|uniref:T cell receptor beta chain MC.7.G5-like n=1 Tax=Clupea harengus TaxID=7950 RepID=UPI001C597C33|nr:T cell receptor beta chain MC.7.G5-like [Clupea harengus]